MRFMFRFSMPTEAGNAAARDGFSAIQRILAEQKPEAAYFFAHEGKRTAFLVMQMNDASEIPKIAEPWFLALNATVDVQPVMVPEDLKKAGPAIEQAVKNYG